MDHSTDWERLDEPNRTLIDRYLRFRRNRLAALTREAYRSDLASLGGSLSGASLLAATAEQVNQWLSERTREPGETATEGRPWSRRTAQRKRSSVSAFFDWAVREELLDKNPVDRVELGRPPRPIPFRLGLSEVLSLFEYLEYKMASADPRQAQLYVLDNAIFHLCFFAALRVSEASHLRRSQIHYQDGELLAEVARKGGRQDLYPIVGRLLSAYRRWTSLRAEVPVKPEFNDYVFVHPWTGHRLSRQRASQRLRRIAREAGLPEELVRRLSTHKLRHAKAYAELAGGASLADVQALLGHASIATTGIYTEHDVHGRLAVLRRAAGAG